MQDLVTFLSTKMSYEEDPTQIFAERFPQFLAMYKFIAPSINYIERIVVINSDMYLLYFLLPLKYFYNSIHNNTVEIDGQIYRSIVNLDTNCLILTITEEES